MPLLPDAIRQIQEYPLEHLRVLGLPGSGKTRALIERYKSLSRRGEGIFIVTFSREELKRITAAIIDDGGEGMPPVLTYFTLAREVITGSGRPLPHLVQDIEERMIVQKSIERCQQNLKSDYKTIITSDSLQREILEVFHLLLQHDITGDRIDRLQSVNRDDRLTDILTLYRHYLDALSDKGYATYSNISRIAADACDGLPKTHPLRRVRGLLVDDFQDVDSGQFSLLRRLAPPDGETLVNVFGDPMGAYFGFRGTQSRFLTEVFPEMYTGATVVIGDPSSRHKALDRSLSALAREVLGDEASAFAKRSPTSNIGPLFDGLSTSDESGNDEDVVLVTAADEIEEIYGAAVHVRRWIEKERLDPGDVAIITNDRRRYEPMLRAAFAQHGVPVDTGRPTQDVFRNFVHSLLTLLVSRQDNVAQQAILTSPFYHHFRGALIPSPRTADQARERETLMRWIAAARLPERSSDVIQHVIHEWLKPACDRYREETYDESAFTFLSLLSGRWDEYVSATRIADRSPNIREFIGASDLFRVGGTSPMPSREEVGLYTCRETKGRFFRRVVLLGCSELLFPAAQRRDYVVPAAALQKVCNEAVPELAVEVHGARSPLTHLREEYHLMYLSMTRALDGLYLSAPKTFAGQSHPAPATILAEALPQSSLGAVPVESITPPQIRFAREWIRQDKCSRLAGRLAALSPFGRLWNLTEVVRRDLTIDRFPLSKSSLGSYLRCPRQFFYEKVLRIRQEESDPLLVGNLFHAVMAKVNTRYPNKRDLHDQINEEIVSDTVEEVIQETRAPSRPLDRQSLYGASLRFHLSSMIRGALSHDGKDPVDYEVMGTEASFAFEHGGQGFRGQFDRVDETPSGGAILDYKTGEFDKMASTLRRKTLYALDNPGKANWQVPIYVWGYRGQKGESPDAFRHLVQGAGEDPFFVTLYIRRRKEDVPDGALSTKREHKEFSYLLDEEVEDIMNEAVARANEIFSARERFEKTDTVSHCGNCMFKRVCDRGCD